MESRVSGIYSMAHPVTESDLEAAFKAPASVIADFKAAAEQAVKAGADVVIPAEGVLNEVLFANGVHAISEAAIMDCVGVVLLYAELLVNMKKRLGIGVGRRWTYAKLPAELLAQLNLVSRFPK
jgi:hypothetical protein